LWFDHTDLMPTRKSTTDQYPNDLPNLPARTIHSPSHVPGIDHVTGAPFRRILRFLS